MVVPNRVYGISGIPLGPDVEFKTDTLPFAPNMPVRVEISKLANPQDPLAKKQWTLFVMALHKFKCMSVDDKLSYFQVAGIHGYPQTSWDGAEDPPKEVPKDIKVPAGSDRYGGYCHHNKITFGTWHRPYMLLFEKLIWTNMYKVIEEWKKINTLKFDENEWEKAADLWRLPYWDWASRNDGEFSLPKAFVDKCVKIYPPTLAEGKANDTHENPLCGFVNPEKYDDGTPRKFGDMPKCKEKWNIKDHDDDNYLPWSQCSGTSRYGLTYADKENGDPKNLVGHEGVNGWEAVDKKLRHTAFYSPYKKETMTKEQWEKLAPGNLADAINRMFSSHYTDTWGSFSTTKWWAESERNTSTGYLSLEYLHNNVHNICGGGENFGEGIGHMADVPVSAFDPLFWMHHCNIDRLLATWQVLNWKGWWNTPEPTHKEENFPDPSPWDPLKPFHNVDGGDPLYDFWTSQMVRDWTKLGYQYDTLRPKPSAILPEGVLDEEQYKRDVHCSILETYPGTLDFARKILANKDIENERFFGNLTKGGSTDPKKFWFDYLINVQYDRYALKGRSYSIQFWLSENPLNPDNTCGGAGTMIGQVYSLGGLKPASDGSEGCGNCSSQQQNGVLSGAQVPITIPIMLQAITDNEYIKSIDEESVKVYLKKHLFWKYVEIGGVERKACDFPRTKICVFAGKGWGIPSPDAKEAHPAPFYDAYRPISRPTRDKEGGLESTDPVLGKKNSDNWKFRGLPRSH